MCSYESVKSSIRLLLTSASNGLSLQQLNDDYQNYNQSKNIPYSYFGYSTLFDFLRDMPDVAQFDTNYHPPIVYGIKTSRHPTKRQILLIEPTNNNNHSLQSNENVKTSLLHNKNISSFEKMVNKHSLGPKNVKRLVLNTLSNNNRPHNFPIFPSTEHIIHQLTNLKMTSQHFYPNQLMTISLNPMHKCQILRYSNGKVYIPCFELARILNIKEDILDKETMFSRLRIYQSDDLFNQFKNLDNCCQHRMNSRRPYIFLFLISSIIPVLKMTKNLNRYYEIVLAFERLLNM